MERVDGLGMAIALEALYQRTKDGVVGSGLGRLNRRGWFHVMSDDLRRLAVIAADASAPDGSR